MFDQRLLVAPSDVADQSLTGGASGALRGAAAAHASSYPLATMDHPPRLLPLDEPRELSRGEAALIHRVLDLAEVNATTRSRLLSARVIAACSCGCPSIGLDDATVDEKYGDEPRSIMTRSRVGDVEVNLHLGYGTPTELEVWSGDEAMPSTLPDPQILQMS